MQVVDASVIAAILLKENKWDKLLSRITKGSSYIPCFAVAEVTNAIWKSTIITSSDKSYAFGILESLLDMINEELIQIVSEKPFLGEALKISLDNRFAIYDAIYIAMAKKFNYTLLTRDKKQAEIAKKLGVDVELF